MSYYSRYSNPPEGCSCEKPALIWSEAERRLSRGQWSVPCSGCSKPLAVNVTPSLRWNSEHRTFGQLMKWALSVETKAAKRAEKAAMKLAKAA